MARPERSLKFQDLLVALTRDENEIRRQLWVVQMLMVRGDYDLAEERTIELWAYLNSHLAREESRVRDLKTASLISSTSDNRTAMRKEQLIETLVAEHKSITDSFEQMRHLTRLSSDMERFSCFENFEKTLLSFLSHEDQVVLPFLLEMNEERNQAIAEERKSQELVLAP